MKSHVSRNASGAISNLGGLKFAAEVLNKTDRTKEQRILEDIKAIEEPVYQKIEEQLFVFEDIVQLDDRTLQSILKEVTTDVLVVALRATDQSVQDKFFGNMSTRAADIIKEEMEMRGPVRLKEVEQAQQDLIAVAKGLEQAGKITLRKGWGGRLCLGSVRQTRRCDLSPSIGSSLRRGRKSRESVIWTSWKSRPTPRDTRTGQRQVSTSGLEKAEKLLRRLEGLIFGLEKTRAELYGRLEQEILDLVIRIAEKVIHAEIRSVDSTRTSILEAGLRQAQGQRKGPGSSRPG